MKRFLTLLAFVALTITANAVIQSGSCGVNGDNVTFVLNDDGTLVISGSGDMYEYNGYAPWSGNRSKIIKVQIEDGVTSIGSDAFHGCAGLTSVSIGNSVASIGDYAFASCTGLISVTIPNSVTSIGTDVFNTCKGLTSVTIGNSVTSIGEKAFSWCSSLTSLKVDEENPCYCSIDNVLFNKEMTKLICCAGGKKGDIIIPNSVKKIESYAFCYCTSLTSVTIPNSVTSIENNAFEGCSGLTSVTIPNSVTSIGQFAFYGCKGLTCVTISNSVTSIEQNTFCGCSSLTSVTIPNSITNIDYNAFRGCSSLTSVTIGNSVTSIGDSAFDGCKNLTSITFPNSVSSIGRYAFYGCDRIGTIFWNSNMQYSFGSNYKYIKEIHYGDDIMIAYQLATYTSSLQKVVIGKNIEYIRNDAFKGAPLKEFHITGKKDIYLYPGVFDNVNTSNCTLYVPKSREEYYKTTAPWSEFGTIVPVETDIEVSSITLNLTSKELTVGESFTLTATVLPEDAENKTVTWSSSDTNVATVDATTGEVTAVGEGTATITATAADGSGVTGTCEITVKAAQGGSDDPSTSGTVDVTPRPTSGNYMFVDYVKAKAKQTVQIPVEVVTEEENIVGFQCNIKLPEGMEFVKNAKGNVVFTWNNDRIDGHTITSKIAADGSVKLLAASMNGSTFMETEGVMFYFSATVPEGMEGEQALQLYNVRVSDSDDNEIRCPDMTSVIDVKTYTLGDLNDDGEWSVVDVTMAIKAILDETYIEAGDMNEDGEMSVVDATTIIKYVLNEGPIEKASAPATKKLKANAIADKPKFVVSPIYVEPGTNNMYLTVDMLNKEEYIGFQTEICLPEGFKFYTNSKGKPTVTLNTDRLETHTATSKLKDERTLRILVASMESDPILDNEGELLRVRVVADANVEAGNHTATLIDSRVSDDNDIETKLDVTNGYLRVFGEEAISLVVPDGGYATLCLPYNATIPAGLKAYKATGMKNGMVVIEEQTSIAACTPMIIEGTAGTYNFSGDNSDADEFEYSVGSLKSSLVPAKSSNGYVLQNLSEGLGFYKIADALTVPSFRCVLDGASVSAAPAFVPVGFEEDANAISSVETAMKNGSAVYTLDGKRVKTMEKGKVYIVGGVKMIVK